MENPLSNTTVENGAPSREPSSAPPALAPDTIDEQKVWEVLRTCFDPEIPLNIVDLGLVYDVSLKGHNAAIRMTLTAPGCPMAGQIATDVQTKVLGVENVEEVNVELVWDPPWHQGMITEAGRLELGLM